MSRRTPSRKSAAPPAGHRDELFAVLDVWVERGWLRALDRALAGFLFDLRPDTDPKVGLGAALASHQLGHGHSCLDLAETLANPEFTLSLPPEAEEGGVSQLPSDVLAGLGLDGWKAALRASPLVQCIAAPGEQQSLFDDAAVAGDDESARPLVLAGARLYLRRYWRFERQVVEALRARLRAPDMTPDGLARRLGQLFGEPPVDEAGVRETDWQKVACALAARGAFTIVTGGPGTGKTTTVMRLLALLQEPAIEAGRPLRIRLAAPTGKAAARLSASIGEQLGRLGISDEARASIPTSVTTLHRLLGSRPDSRHFRHHAGQPLQLDVLIVDEASMIDLEMTASLLDALPPHARLVLIGDKDQLASVEAGAVLGDLCRDAEAGRYGEATRQWLERVTGETLSDPQLLDGDAATHPLAQQTVMLRRSRRFGQASGIGLLARTVNAGDVAAAWQALDALTADPASDVCALSADRIGAGLEGLLLDGRPNTARGPAPGYTHYLGVLRERRPDAAAPANDPAWEDWARAVLEAFDRFRLLCAVRRGEFGVEGLNARIAQALLRRGLIERDEGWYEGRPVLVTRNDYSVGLVNGDVGVALSMPGAADGSFALRVAFPRNDGSGGVRFVLPSRLIAVETTFAMTVHKSQGSEFAHTALVLPDKANPVLTRELVYTGITRATTWFSLAEGAAGIFEAAVAHRVQRSSGLDI